MNKILFCFITLLLLISCSSEKHAGTDAQKPSDSINEKGAEQTSNQPGISEYALEVYPSEASRNSILSLRSKGLNLENAKIEWLVNNRPVVGALAYQFKPIDAKKGDKVQAKAIIKNGVVVSNIVTIKNAPPEISRIKIMPEVFKTGDTLYVDVSGSDADGDEVTILYEWTNNGESAGNDKKIAVPLKRGDKITIKITPFDGVDYGQTAVLHREIGNMPPHIIDYRKYTFDGRTYTYQVKASDPDNDPLTYSLKTSPQGMTINQSTGLVQWNVPSGFTGKASFTVSVTDGHGGHAAQELAVNITPEKAK